MLIKLCLLKGSVTKTDNTWGYKERFQNQCDFSIRYWPVGCK